MKILYKILISLLLLILVYTRFTIRANSPFWTDEIEQIKHLTSFRHIVFEYLPSIPGGSLGHFLITLPLNLLFPGNKYALGLPGIISHILVFLLIPKVVSLMRVVKPQKIYIVATIARIGFVLDPMFTFQAMEVRPYSVLPFLWVISVIFCARLCAKNISVNRMSNLILITSVAVLIFVWHFYGFIMVMTVFIYLLSKRKSFNLNQIRRSLYTLPLLLGTLISLPIWRHLASGGRNYRHNTFEFIPNFWQLITMNRGVLKTISWQHQMYIFFLVMSLIFIAFVITGILKKSLFFEKLYLWEIGKMLVILVITPILTIFVLDLMHPYWFLYRQFAWTMLPFYITLGVFITGVRISTI